MNSTLPPVVTLGGLIASWTLGFFTYFGVVALPFARTRRLGLGLVALILVMLKVRLPRSKKVLQWIFRNDPRNYWRQAGGDARLIGHVDSIRPQNSMFLVHPHGILCGGFSLNVCWAEEFHARCGDCAFLIDPVLRNRNPVFKWLCDLHGGLTQLTTEVMRTRTSAGQNIVLQPGGFKEASLTTRGRDRVALDTKCFDICMKLALEAGTRVHPIYTFGEVDQFYTFTGLEKLRLWITKMNIPAVAFTGNVPLPLLSLFQIRSTKLLSVVGRPVKLPPLSDGQKHATKEDVVRASQIYESALIDLFEEFKHEAGMGGRTLEIFKESKL